jgi:hypothetical protein
MIKQAMDRMMQPEKYSIEMPAEYETDKTKRIEILLKEENSLSEEPEEKLPAKDLQTKREMTRTYENVHGYRFEVPSEVYSDAKYRHKLNYAQTIHETTGIVRDFDKHQKKHGWNKS